MSCATNNKAHTIIKEIIDPRGRFIKEEEFKWLMNYFSDRYDPRRLCIAVMTIAGLRLENGTTLKRGDFNEDFSYLKVTQCKANVRRKDGKVKITTKPRLAYIPEWLQKDLQAYIDYRVRLGYYHNFENPERLWPALKKEHLHNLFSKLRKRFGNQQKWLCDVWYREIRIYDDNTQMVKNVHRVAPHACRAVFCTEADKLVGHDSAAGKLLSGHERISDYERYTKYREVDQLRKQISNVMNNYNEEQKTPVMVGQTKICNYSK